MSIVVGYDLDGVIAKEYRLLHWLIPYFPNIGVYIRDNLIDPLYVPNYGGFIITGRPEIDRLSTEEWLAYNHIGYRKLIMASSIDRSTVVEFKARQIALYGITHYVESDAAQIQELNALLSGSTVQVLSVKQAIQSKLLLTYP